MALFARKALPAAVYSRLESQLLQLLLQLFQLLTPSFSALIILLRTAPLLVMNEMKVAKS